MLLSRLMQIGKGRRGNRESVYLSDEIAQRFGEFMKGTGGAVTKSRIVEIALDIYLDLARVYDVDRSYRPCLKLLTSLKGGGEKFKAG